MLRMCEEIKYSQWCARETFLTSHASDRGHEYPVNSTQVVAFVLSTA